MILSSAMSENAVWNKDEKRVRWLQSELLEFRSLRLFIFCPYHDDDEMFHVPNCQFKLLFPLNVLN